ncbi:MFS transporter [Nocardia gipuzkoensis]|uniref:MFS transporter n=1 Tax=Nocardia gipuzkoensis TaxID=2749991 RepID=UPI001E29D41B|nr:MFS transporter [Nocardia gipuzkoensis]UGT67803.1 MFS transporter [Nocardia gipuzkoensis]
MSPRRQPAPDGDPASKVTSRDLPVILGLASAFTITVLDPLVLSLNLPQVSRDLRVPPQLAGVLGGTATLVMAAAVLAAGNLADAFGLKRLLMIGLSIVTVADLLSLLSPGYVYLFAMRVLGGLGMTALLGVPLALLKTSVPEKKRPGAIGVFMAVEMILCGVIPALTGWMVTAVGWRSLFLVAPSLSLLALWLTAVYVPESPARQRPRLDVIGVALVGSALLGLVVGIAAAQKGMLRPETWLPFVFSAAAATAFALHERRTPEPALDLTLFRSATFSVALAAALTLNFLSAGLGVALGQFGGKVLALSPEAIGALYLPGTLLIAGAVVLAGRLVGAYSPRPVLIVGLLLLSASGLLMAGTVSPRMALWLLVLATWLCNLGALVTATSVSEMVLSQAPRGRAGTVASVQLASGMTGYALGPTVYLLLLSIFFRQEWLADAHSRALSTAGAERAVDAARSAAAHSPGSAGYDPNLLRQAAGLRLDVDFADALRLTMLTVSFLPIVVAVAALLLVRRGTERGGSASEHSAADPESGTAAGPAIEVDHSRRAGPPQEGS